MRKLTLTREHLSELTSGELTGVVAASGVTCVQLACVRDLSDRLAACDSLLRPCISATTCTC
jgi:hypothetical protein